MKKVLDKDLEKAIEGMSAAEVVELLREKQDASGIKVCMNVNENDPAYVKL